MIIEIIWEFWVNELSYLYIWELLICYSCVRSFLFDKFYMSFSILVFITKKFKNNNLKQIILSINIKYSYSCSMTTMMAVMSSMMTAMMIIMMSVMASMVASMMTWRKRIKSLILITWRKWVKSLVLVMIMMVMMIIVMSLMI